MDINLFLDIDLSDIPNDILDVDAFAKKSGLIHINECIKKRLSAFSEQYFFEYSILSALLDPNKNKMHCFAGIYDDTESQLFRKIFGQYCHEMIRTAQPNDKENEFHNPELFIAPSKIAPFITNERRTYDSLVSKLKSNKLFFQRVSGSNLSVYNMTYSRTFDELISYAKHIKETRKGDLIKSFQDDFIYIKSHFDDLLVKKNVIVSEQTTYYLTFPLISPTSVGTLPDVYNNAFGKDTIRNQGLGCLLIYFIPKKDIDEDKLRIECNELFNTVNDLILLFIINYVFNTGLILLDFARKQSIISAKAAIMSRNMSHNLGSHVMAYLKQHLNSVQEILSNNILSEFIPSNLNFDKFEISEIIERLQEIEKSKEIENKELLLPFLVGLGRFISYLQERQDFIATIATGYIPYYAAVNFKDFIYDELNPDLRHQRHNERSGMKPDNILLGNIARSEGLARETRPTYGKELYDIVLSFRDFNGKIPDVNSESFKALDDMRKCVFSLPGGVVGRQAIFSIVENTIRNAAKHGNWRASISKHLEIKFDVFAAEDFTSTSEDRRIEAFRSMFDKYYKDATDINDLFIVTITDNLKLEVGFNGVIEKLREAIIDPYIESGSNNMANTNKGIKEMRISAAWLRSMDDDVINHPYANGQESIACWSAKDKPAPIFLADIDSGSLRYTFCVLRQKKVAIITTETTKEQLQSIATDKAWSILTIEEYMNPKTNKSFEFVILDTSNGAELKKEWNNLRRISHNRIYQDDKIVRRLIDDSSSFDEEYLYLHKKLAIFNEGEVVSIHDSEKDGEVKAYKTTSKYINSGNVVGGEYLYKKHLETKSNYIDFINGNSDKSNKFVESITGNNSTDRLIRNEILDDAWAYRHMRAMKAKVAIFDERLFSKIFKLEEADLITAEVAEISSMDIIPDKPIDDNRTMTEYIADITDEGKLSELIDLLEETDEQLYTNIFNSEKSSYSDDEKLNKLREFVNKNIDQFNTKVENTICEWDADYLSIIYNLKGVDIFSILKTKDRLDIYGYIGESNKNGQYYGRCSKIGTIEKFTNEGEYQIKITSAIKYDYMSIHQGLLDKIYELLGIKDNAQEKFIFTKDFYNQFSKFGKDGEGTEQKTEESDDEIKTIRYMEKAPKSETLLECFYLPQMYIHSGRSKPSYADMPQKQPFIQYAAIEHAVLDCKYSLVELLDFARYE